MAPVQLAYWDIRGLAQPIRLLLEYTGTEWEDKLYACGPAPDFDKSCWFPIKESLGLDFPNLPYLIDGDVKLSQTQAILRYVARKNGLLGADDTEAMKADLVAAEWADFNAPFVSMCYSPNFETLKTVYLKEGLPLKLKRFSAFLGDMPYFAGKNLTFADFLMYEMFDQHKLLDPTCLKPYKNLEEFVDRIENLDRIKEYLKSSRFIKYPLNNKMASFGG